MSAENRPFIQLVKEKVGKTTYIIILAVGTLGIACSTSGKASSYSFLDVPSSSLNLQTILEEEIFPEQSVNSGAVHEYKVDFDGKIGIAGIDGSQVIVQVNNDDPITIKNHKYISFSSGNTIYITTNQTIAKYIVSFDQQ